MLTKLSAKSKSQAFSKIKLSTVFYISSQLDFQDRIQLFEREKDILESELQ
jgi:hypothetical protein